MSTPTPIDALDRAVETLQANKDRWARLPLPTKLDFARQLVLRTQRVAARQVRAAAEAKGVAPDDPATAEDWLGGPVCQIRTIRLLAETLSEVVRRGAPKIARDRVHVGRNGQVAVDVIPASTLDRLLFTGFSAQVWMDPAVRAEDIEAKTAGFYRRQRPDGATALVLGAGNVASIGPLDVVHKLFVEGQVSLLKFNPVNEYLGPFFEEVFAPLIREGFVATAYGGADVGDYLCQHPGIDEIHITGSDRTHDVIVFGPGEAGAARKADNNPRTTKRITSELGNVSPVIIVPGPWNAADIRFHCENIATQMTNNASFNCNAAKVLVMWDGWPQRALFLDTLRKVLGGIAPRRAYYPGAEDRYARFMDAHPGAWTAGPREPGIVPWTLISDVDPAKEDEICFRSEAFCGVLAQTALGGDDANEFLTRAVDFCNDRLWGTLNACVIAHPKTEQALGRGLDQAAADLRYGSVSINHWPALSYALGTTTWGAYPGHTLDDIQSGIGVVHNTLMFDRPQNTIVRGPFRVVPKPPWFVTHRRAHTLAQKLAQLEAAPQMRRLPGVIWQAIRA